MAVISYTKTPIDPGRPSKGLLVEWLAIGDADTCQPFVTPVHSNATIQVDGTFASATVLVKGSNKKDGSSPLALVDIFENAMSFLTAASIKKLSQNPLTLIPSTSGGSGSSLNVRILFYFQA